MKLIILIGILNFISLQAQDLATVKPNCFYNKDYKLILKIENENEFLLVDKEVLFGTKFLLVEKGYIQHTTTDGLEFMTTSVANRPSSRTL